jgi:hypothetical protein
MPRTVAYARRDAGHPTGHVARRCPLPRAEPTMPASDRPGRARGRLDAG